MAMIQAPYRQAGFASQAEYEQYQRMQALQLQQQQAALQQSREAAAALKQQTTAQQPTALTGMDYQKMLGTLQASTRESGEIAPAFRPAGAGERKGEPGYDAYLQERNQYYTKIRREIASGESPYKYATQAQASQDIRSYLDRYTESGMQQAQLEGSVGLQAPSAAGFNQYRTALTGGGTGGATNTGGGLPSLGGGGQVPVPPGVPTGETGGPLPVPVDQPFSIQPYTGGQQQTSGGGGTMFGGYSQTGGGGGGTGYPAPGTMVPTSYSIAGSAGGFDTLDTAIGETKDIYGNIVPHQAGLVDTYSQESRAAAQQMQDTAAQYGQREQDLGGMLQGYGDYERQQIEARRIQAIEAKKQELINRGATNQSSYESAMRSLNQTAGDQLSQYEDMLTRRKMDYLSMLSGDRLQAQSAAAGFSADQAAQRFTAAQTPVQSMSDLAALLAQQRDSAANRAAQLSVSQQDIGLEYAKLAESARQASADRTLMQMQMGQQSALGYADLASQYAAQRLASSTAKSVASIQQPSNSKPVYGGSYGF